LTRRGGAIRLVSRTMTSNRTVRRVAIVGLLLVAVAACGSDSDEPSSSGSSGTKLVGTHWLLSDTEALPTDGVSVTAEFADGRMSGSSGCNTYSAPFTVDHPSLTIGPDIASTLMACDAGPAEVEIAYLEALPKVAEYQINGETLTLRDADGETLLTYDAVDSASAILGMWTATSYYTGDAVQSVVIGSTLTADFEGDEVSGDSGCNTFGGPYTAAKNTIEMGPFRSTLRACADPEVQAQEQHYLAALELATTFRVTGDQLQLFRDGDGIAATFVRTPDAG
jgi:heat shock protein HslJ